MAMGATATVDVGAGNWVLTIVLSPVGEAGWSFPVEMYLVQLALLMLTNKNKLKVAYHIFIFAPRYGYQVSAVDPTVLTNAKRLQDSHNASQIPNLIGCLK